MSGKREKQKRRQKKIQASRFSTYLDAMEARFWLKHKQTNPDALCNTDFQAKLETA